MGSSWLQVWSYANGELLCQGILSASHSFGMNIRKCTHVRINAGRHESRIITVQRYIWGDLIKSVCHYLSVSLSHVISISLPPLPSPLSSLTPLSASLLVNLVVLSLYRSPLSLPSFSPLHTPFSPLAIYSIYLQLYPLIYFPLFSTIFLSSPLLSTPFPSLTPFAVNY